MMHFLKKTIRTYNDGRVEEILARKPVYEHDHKGRIVHSKDNQLESWYSYDGHNDNIVFERHISYINGDVLSTTETAYKYDSQARMVMEKITKDGVINTYTMKYDQHGVIERCYNGVVVESIEYKDDSSVKKHSMYEDGKLTNVDEYLEDGDMHSLSINPDGTWQEETWYNTENFTTQRRIETIVCNDGAITVLDYEYVTVDDKNYPYKIVETFNGELESTTYYKGTYMIERQTKDYTETFEYTRGP